MFGPDHGHPLAIDTYLGKELQAVTLYSKRLLCTGQRVLVPGRERPGKEAPRRGRRVFTAMWS